MYINNMSNTKLLESLAAQVKTLTNAIETLGNQQENTNSQVSEMYQLLTALNIKIDTIDQRDGVFPAADANAVKPTKSDKPPKKSKGAASKRINKLDFFKQEYNADNKCFNVYLTEEVRKNILDENKEKWDKLSESKRKTSIRHAYYTYMKTNHDSELQAMKKAYIDKISKKDIELVKTEEDSDGD